MDFIEAIIKVTEERDSKSIKQSLLTALVHLIDFDTLTLFHRPRDLDANHIDVCACQPENLFDNEKELSYYTLCHAGVALDKHIKQCIDSADIVSVTINDQERLLIPVIINKLVTGILDIQGFRATSCTKENLLSFMRIFNNFLVILNDNEHDTLTGLLNRKTFDNQLSELTSCAENDDKPKKSLPDRRKNKTTESCWIGVLDIDHFKSINDNHGHMIGDEILLLFSNLMKKTFRGNDLLFRYGGEEFVVVLAPTSEKTAMVAFNRFREILENYDFPQVHRVTASLGVVKITKEEHPTTLLEQADKALYYAKDHGRNQVCNYHTLISRGKLQETHIADDLEFF